MRGRTSREDLSAKRLIAVSGCLILIGCGGVPGSMNLSASGSPGSAVTASQTTGQQRSGQKLADAVLEALKQAGSARVEAQVQDQPGSTSSVRRLAGVADFRRDAVDLQATGGSSSGATPIRVVMTNAFEKLGDEWRPSNRAIGTELGLAPGETSLLGTLTAFLQHDSFALVGEEDVEGSPASVYEAIEEPRKQGDHRVTARVWTDRSGRLVRASRLDEGHSAERANATLATVTLSDFGLNVSIEIP